MSSIRRETLANPPRYKIKILAEPSKVLFRRNISFSTDNNAPDIHKVNSTLFDVRVLSIDYSKHGKPTLFSLFDRSLKSLLIKCILMV